MMELEGLRDVRTNDVVSSGLYTIFKLDEAEQKSFRKSFDFLKAAEEEMSDYSKRELDYYDRSFEVLKTSVNVLRPVSVGLLFNLIKKGLSENTKFGHYRTCFQSTYILELEDVTFCKVGGKDLVLRPMFKIIPDLGNSLIYCTSNLKIIESFSYPFNPLFDFFSKRYKGNNGVDGPKVESFGLNVHSALYVPQVINDFKNFCNYFDDEMLTKISYLNGRIYKLKGEKSIEKNAELGALRIGLDRMIQDYFE